MGFFLAVNTNNLDLVTNSIYIINCAEQGLIVICIQLNIPELSAYSGSKNTAIEVVSSSM